MKKEIVKNFTESLIKRFNSDNYIYEYNELSQQFAIKDKYTKDIVISISYEAMYRMGYDLYKIIIETLIKRGYIKD